MFGQAHARPFAAPAKFALHNIEKCLGCAFSGLGAAASAVASLEHLDKTRKNKITKMLRHLAVAEALDRHFTEQGVEKWMTNLQLLISGIVLPVATPGVVQPQKEDPDTRTPRGRPDTQLLRGPAEEDPDTQLLRGPAEENPDAHTLRGHKEDKPESRGTKSKATSFVQTGRTTAEKLQEEDPWAKWQSSPALSKVKSLASGGDASADIGSTVVRPSAGDALQDQLNALTIKVEALTEQMARLDALAANVDGLLEHKARVDTMELKVEKCVEAVEALDLSLPAKMETLANSLTQAVLAHTSKLVEDFGASLVGSLPPSIFKGEPVKKTVTFAEKVVEDECKHVAQGSPGNMTVSVTGDSDEEEQENPLDRYTSWDSYNEMLRLHTSEESPFHE